MLVLAYIYNTCLCSCVVCGSRGKQVVQVSVVFNFRVCADNMLIGRRGSACMCEGRRGREKRERPEIIHVDRASSNRRCTSPFSVRIVMTFAMYVYLYRTVILYVCLQCHKHRMIN